MIESQLNSYLKECYEITQPGDAREESYYSTLKKLFTDCAAVIGYNLIQITSQPKKTEAGNPDFRVWDGKQHITGYIEAKAPSVKYLDQTETSLQLKTHELKKMLLLLMHHIKSNTCFLFVKFVKQNGEKSRYKPYN